MRSGAFLALLASVSLGAAAFAQQGSAATAAGQSVAAGAPDNDNNGQAVQTTNDQDVQITPMARTPVYRVTVVERTAEAVDYRARGSTKVNIEGTSLQPQIAGDAKVSSHTGRLALDVSLYHLQPARSLGPVYLTYVLWGITPEGRAVNLGEVVPNEDHDAHLQLTTALQSFGLIMTAEPYFAVTRPSDMIVAQNVIPNNVKGWPRPIDTKFEALQRGQYAVNLNPVELPAVNADKKVPLSLLEARNAVAIAQAAGARQYASDTMAKATTSLDRAEDYYRRHQPTSAINTVARAAAQSAEDARLLTIDRKEQMEQAAARQRLQTRIANAKSEADAARERAQLSELKAKQEAEQRTQAEEEREAAQREAELARQERAAAQQELQQAEAARQAAQQQQQQLATQAEEARLQAQQAEQARLQTEQQAQQQRARLISQLNQVLQTRETARGLVSRMPDVLFATNKATLRPQAKIRLAKVAGIIMAYPDLKLEIDGYTDSTGTPQYNEMLSQERAAAVRAFLISQGVPVDNIVARGFGETDPIASNATAQGRQENRRVELVVSGTAIGMSTPAAPAASPGTSANGGVSGAAVEPVQPAVTGSAQGTAVAAPAGSSSTTTTTTTTTPAAPATTPSNSNAAPAAAPPVSTPPKP